MLQLFCLLVIVVKTGILNGFTAKHINVRKSQSHDLSVYMKQMESNFRSGKGKQNFLESFGINLPFSAQREAQSSETQRRNELKADILSLCVDKNVQRSAVQDLILELSSISPIKETATSPLLQKEWFLTWTTEKEINIFQDRGWSKDIRQTVSFPKLNNSIYFVNGGGFFVDGKLSRIESSEDENKRRTYFEFEKATLDLTGIFGKNASWAKLSFPPIGKGWFDTLYLDDELRIDVNIRNDILICTSKSPKV